MKVPIPGLILFMLLAAAMAGNPGVLLPDYLRRISYIDSEQMNETFSEGMLKLLRDGRMVKTEVLRQQLSRKQCSIPLPSISETTMPPIELYRKNKAAVLIIGSLRKCGKCSKWHASGNATGFLVSPEGIMLTNYHVIHQDKAEMLAAMTCDGEVFPVVEVLAANKEADIAVLRIDGTGLPCLSLFPDCPVGSRVWVISNPAKQFYTFTEGMVSARYVDNSKGMQSRRVSVTTAYAGGSSGAPLFNEQGNVVGMVCGTQVISNNPKPDSLYFQPGYPQMVFNYCIPSELIQALFMEE